MQDRRWIRQYKVEIINPSQSLGQVVGGKYNLLSNNFTQFKTRVISSVGVEEPLNVSFNIEAGSGSGLMSLSIFNLSETTISDIMVKDSFIKLSVGYGFETPEEDLSQLFYGKITHATTHYGSDGRKTAIKASAGDILNFLPIAVKSQEDTRWIARIIWFLDIINEYSGNNIAVEDAKDQLSSIARLEEEGSNGVYLFDEIKGTETLVGNAGYLLSKYLRPHRISWTTVDDKLILTRRGFVDDKFTAKVLTLGEELLTIPKRSVDDDNQVSTKDPVDFTHTILIDPTIKPGSSIQTNVLIDEQGRQIEQEIIQSVQKIKITGDYESNNWYMKLSCTEDKRFSTGSKTIEQKATELQSGILGDFGSTGGAFRGVGATVGF
tara:strand:+ start:44374 stop:45510 length:1137 start_codon:yes stop_codon:yes gene_type:complete